MIDIGLLDLALNLPFSMATTDLVRREIEDPKQARALAACIKKRKISVIASTIQEMSAISDCMNAMPSLSLADSSVLYHAADKKGIVITGDGQFRKAATARHLEVHGTPWILSRLVATKGIDPSRAIEKMDLLLEINPRLPHKECRKLQDAWRLQLPAKASRRG
ncbi:MAG TPA: hypothetical protein PKZ09_09660 [Bacillota bacterium]|nr:hypothetical protein [Bacillota bacterium]